MSTDWWTRRDGAELFLQRIAFGTLAYLSFRMLPRFSAQPFPVGIARWIDFSWIGSEPVTPWVDAAFLAATLCYIAGRALLPAVAVMALLYIGAGAVAYSQGSLQHRTQLLALVLLAQLAAYLHARSTAQPRARAHALATHYALEVIAASYLLAGAMKIVLSSGQWLAQVPMVAVDVAKAHGQLSCTTGDAALLERADDIASAILAHPNLTRALFAPVLLLEIGAPVAVLGRGAAFVVGSCLFVMHRGIDAVMTIRFWENEALLLIYLVNVPYVLLRVARRFRWPPVGTKLRESSPAARAPD